MRSRKMIPDSVRPRTLGWAWLGMVAVSAVTGAGAATLAVPAVVSVLPSAPDGSSASGTGGGSVDLAGSLLEGVTFATTLAGTYDSNVTRSSGAPNAPVEADYFLTLGGKANYLSKASGWTFGGGVGASYDNYFDNSDFSGLNYDAKGTVNYEGGPLIASLESGVAMVRGGNRYYTASFSEILTSTTSLKARYRLSPKTTLAGTIGQTYNSTSGSFNDTESFDAGASVLWKYSPLTEFGPGVRYSYRTGSAQTGRTAIGPTLSMNYKLSTKVMLNSRIGVDFPSYEEGGAVNPTFATAIGLDYQASKLWGMKLSLYRDTQADSQVAGAFSEVTSLRLDYHRKVRRAVLNLGMSYETSAFETLAGVAREDRNYYSIDGSFGMPVFSNSSQASVFIRYCDQTGADFETWDGVQLGFTLGRKF